ncbi:ABC transporter ATP-binding protein [Acidobacteriota bacterium]
MVIHTENLTKLYKKGQTVIKALDGIDLDIQENEFVVVRGPSGSGKTTLLLTIGGMLKPTSGQIIVEQQTIYGMSNSEITHFRAEKIGFIFQMFHLIPYLTALENVMLPLSRTHERNGKNESLEALEQVNMKDRIDHFPFEMSAGEKQRTAIARAMVKKPEILLADEPTGNLDPRNAQEIASLLSGFKQQGCTVIVVSHGRDCEIYCDRMIQLEKGKIYSL